jgi:hypothetical protein
MLTLRPRLHDDDGLASPERGGSAPLSAASRPSPGLRSRLAAKHAWITAPAAVLGLAMAAACAQGSGDQVTTPDGVGMTSLTKPDYSDGEITLYEVYQAVPLPVRKPTAAEEKGLGSAPKGTGYPHAPFLTADDESVEVHWVISNVDTMPHNVWLLLDPWNEFVRWKPGVTVVSDEETVPNNGYDYEYVLPPKSRLDGTFTSDDMHEIAIKLASVENFLASSQAQSMDASADDAPSPVEICNNIFDYQNRSNSVPPDLFYTPWIPSVVAGLTGFDVGLRVEGSADDGTLDGGGANVSVEVTMEIQDLNGNRFVPQDSTDQTIGTPPKVLSPPSARF